MRMIGWVFVAMLTLVAPALGDGVPCQLQPCGLGAGPAAVLAALSGAEFAKGYAQQMFQQNSDVAAVADWGSTRVSDPNLRDFGKKIAGERRDMNRDITALYAALGCGGLMPSATRAQTLEARLGSLCGADLDNNWVTTMMALMDQSRQAAILAQAKSSTAAIRAQAANEAKVEGNEIGAFHRWQNTTFLTHEQEERFCGMHPNSIRCP